MNSEQQYTCLQQAIKDVMRQTSIKDEVARFESSVSGGKMIRGRLVLEIGGANGVPQELLAKLGAAIELLHAGSLLHDDIIDGGTQRRGDPALWVSEGTKSAVLVGDLLLSIALSLVLEAGPQRIPILIRALRQMCDAEAEQEFAVSDSRDTWDDCIRIARHKTGVLFGLAAACAAGSDETLAEALDKAGSDLGTAYQLADDLLDISPDGDHSGKSLGTDAATGKLTAAVFDDDDGIDPLAEIETLLESAAQRLQSWPEIQSCWRKYIEDTIRPILHKFTSHTRVS
jgi:geranylgeranyl pyrophosphate synthase